MMQLLTYSVKTREIYRFITHARQFQQGICLLFLFTDTTIIQQKCKQKGLIPGLETLI